MGEHVMIDGEVRIAGANNWMLLYGASGGEALGHVSIWHVDLSPFGPGCALYWRSSITGGRAEIYSTNADMAAWIREELLDKDGPYHDSSVEIQAATFATDNRLPSSLTETVDTASGQIVVAWEDLGTPVFGYTTADSSETHTHSACYVPAGKVVVTRDGQEAEGSAVPEDWYGTPASSCFLALTETWLRRKTS